jgi:plasmid stabilization system protein ParE
MRYRVSKEAGRDLDEIFLYWARRAGLKVADRLIDGITERFWLLGEYPDAGRSSPEVAAGVKCFPAGKYLIYAVPSTYFIFFTVLGTRKMRSRSPR